MALERVAHTYELVDIVAMRALLAENDIETPELRLSTHVSIAGVDSGYVLEVLRDNADKARWLLRRSEFSKYVIDETPPSSPGLWERIKSYL